MGLYSRQTKVEIKRNEYERNETDDLSILQ